MLPFKQVFVPYFSSQLGSSQRDEPQADQPSQRTPQTKSCFRHQRDAAGKKRLLYKVKLPKRSCTLSKKGNKTQRKWTGEAENKTTVTTVSRKGAATGSDSVSRYVFCFSQRHTSTALNEKDKAKLSVLRTISKMLEDNKLIRQRLDNISQAH